MGASLTAKIFRIFRYTDPTDDILVPLPSPFLDKIDFNSIAVPSDKETDKEHAFVLTCELGEPESLGINLTAEKPDGVTQPQQVLEGVYTITGFISNMRGDADDGNNAFLQLLKTWKNEAQAIANAWNGGRFGIQDFSDSTNTLLPIGTGSDSVGLIFADYQKKNIYNKNRVEFTLTFRRSRGLQI